MYQKIHVDHNQDETSTTDVVPYKETSQSTNQEKKYMHSMPTGKISQQKNHCPFPSKLIKVLVSMDMPQKEMGNYRHSHGNINIFG